MTKVAEILQTPGGSYVIRARAGIVLPLTDAAVTKKHPDGAWTLEPMKDWITPEEAAYLMRVHVTSVLRLRDMLKPDGQPVIEFQRPTPFRVQISLASVLAHLEATRQDPEFWSTCTPSANLLQKLGK